MMNIDAKMLKKKKNTRKPNPIANQKDSAWGEKVHHANRAH